MNVRIEAAGESAFIVYLGERTSPEVSAAVQAAADSVREALGDLLIDLVPSYASLLVIFDVLRCSPVDARTRVRQALFNVSRATATDGRLVILPAWYSSESGADLDDLAERAGLTPQQVIDLHCSTEYRVYAIGFAPGFAYLGEVDERIAAPRLSTPRLKVPRGAVAIADRQTAVYPAESPGGWNLIGLCPQRMFDPAQEPPMPVAVGDRVRFEAIDRDQFLALGGELP